MKLTDQELGKMCNALYAAGYREDIVYGVKVSDLCSALDELQQSREALQEIRDATSELDRKFAPK